MKETLLIGKQEKFKTLNQALQFANEQKSPSTIYQFLISPGLYQEKLNIDLDHVILKGLGEKPEDTRIVWQDGAKNLDQLGRELGTFRTPSLYVDGQSLLVENISIENLAGPGKKIGQAIALALNVNRVVVKNCVLIGDQDTLFLAPLPGKALQKDGFLGSEDWSQREENASIFYKTEIQGGVDFIFGSGAAYFEKCLIRAGKGYITAASTPNSAPYGFIFNHCKIENRDVMDSPCYYLGRPWRNHAKTVFLNTYLDKGLYPEGWHDWNKAEAQKTIQYEEFNNYGPGRLNIDRPSWAKLLNIMPEAYTLDAFIKHYDFSAVENWEDEPSR